MVRRRVLSSALATAVWLALTPCTSAQSARELLERCKPAEVASVAQHLKALGDEGASACIALLVRGEIEASPAARDAARAALPAFRTQLRTQLAELARTDHDAEHWSGAFDALAIAGESADLEFALQLAARFPRAADEDGPSELPLEALSGLRSAAAAIFAHEPRSASLAQHLLATCPPELAPALIGALGDCRTPEAFSLLGEMLARGDERAPQIVVAISNAARGLPGPFDSRVRDAVRWSIEREANAGFREAVICAGWLDDDGSVRTLIALLRHETVGVRSDAMWSLERITGAHLGPDAARWTHWLADQEQWWETRASHLFADLDAEDPAARTLALNELVRHSFPRHDLARELSQHLANLDVESFALGCQTLAQLGSPAALPALEALETEKLDARQKEVLESCIARLAPAAHPAAAKTP